MARAMLARGRWIIPGVAIVTVAAFGLAGVADAVPVDVNPNVSTNSNVNASTGGRVNHMAAVAGDNQTFYLASEYGGVFKSTNGGVNWSRLENHLPVVAWDVEVDPGNTNRVIAASWYDGRVSPLSGIQVSTNAGTTWTHPATSWPDPNLEGTGNDNTPPGWSCANLRSEPSAFGISILGSTVAVGTNCGLALSTNSGSSWSFVDPTPGTAATRIWDVLLQPGGIIDICGDTDNHMRSTDGGTNWTAGGALPNGRCSIAVSPDESDVLFSFASDNLVYESDDGGANWFNLGNPTPQGRIPFVATNQRSNDGSGNNKFDLWAGDVQLFRADCTTPADTTNTTTRRCPASGSWANSQSGAHWDAGDLLFDSEVGNDACPVLFSSDGGVHTNTVGASPACHNPTWARNNVGYHGLWLWAMDGADRAGTTAEDLLFGVQDDGTHTTTNAGANPPTWTNPDCCDGFAAVANPTFTLATTCCATSGRQTNIRRGPAGYAGGGAAIPNSSYPTTAEIDSFNWGRDLVNFGTADGQVAAVFTDGIYITTNANASPIVWTQLPTPPGGAGCGLETSMDGTTPVFFAIQGQCTGRGTDQVWRYVGTATNGTWDRIDENDGLLGGFGIFGVDPNNDDRMYASYLGAATPQMVFTTDAAANWNADAELDTLMTGNGVFKYTNSSGPSTNNGSARAQFQGYPQPMLVAYNPLDANVIVAGGADSGVFLSTDAGANWSLVTDPFAPGSSGKAHLPRPRFAYFDNEPAGTLTVYLGTQGRGVWRLAFQPPTADAGGPYTTPEGTDVVLSAAGSTDPDTQALTYAWDFDGDGQYDDATGVSPTYTNVGQDGAFTVAVKVTDSDGGFDTDTATVTVTNVAPTVSGLASTSPDDEGSTLTVTGLVSDPGWLDPLTGTINWGDGTLPAPLSGALENIRPNATLTFSSSHVYGDDGTFPVTVCGSDDDTTTCAPAFNVQIDNVNPTATIDESGATVINGVPTILAHKGETIMFSGRSTDPGSDDLTLRWSWDDGPPAIDESTLYLVNPPNPDPDPSPSVQPRDITDTKPHVFGDACVYDIVFSAHDDDGGSATDTVKVLITGNADRGRSSGYWSHQYRRQGSTDFTDAELTCYLEIVDFVSNVFHEVKNASTFPLAQSILFTQNTPVNKRDQLDRDLLTAWLNFANGAVEWNELVDTNDDGIVDTAFHTAMANAEAVRLNPASTPAQFDAQRRIVQRISHTI